MQDAPEPQEPRPAPEPEARQRWRLVVARAADAPTQTQRELTEGWEAALQAAALPLARSGPAPGRARPRVSFGAPLPVGMAAEAELIDLVLTERWPAWQLREALEPVVPAGWSLVEAIDVWLAGPPLAGRVAAADYRVVLDGSAAVPAAERLEHAREVVLGARRLERQRRKGDGVVTYDLRPLIVDLRLDAAPPPTVRVRTRLHPELGSGRPEEVVAAMGDVLGETLPVASITRERLVLVDDLADG